MQNHDNSNNGPESSSPHQNIHNSSIYKTILIIEATLILLLATINVLVKTLRPAPSDSPQASEYSICKHGTKAEILNLVDNVTKDDSIEIILKMQGKNGCAPDGLMPDAFKLKPNEFAREILYSYDNPDEVLEIAGDSVMRLDTNSIDDFVIDESTDNYVIVSVDDSRISCGELNEYGSTISCYRGISFNRKYLDYHKVVEGYSNAREMIINDLSKEFVEFSLKIIMATDIMNSDSLYDYYFEDEGDRYVLTGIYFGVGLDMDNFKGGYTLSIPYAINIYEKKLVLDKDSKEPVWEKHTSNDGGESSLTILKSFSLSNDELFGIQSAVSENK